MSDDTIPKILIGAGLASLGIAALGAYEKRRKFRELLGESLGGYGIQLVAAEQGRVAEGKNRWTVTVSHPSSGVARLFSDYPAEADAYAPQTAVELAALIARWYGV